MNGNRQAFLDMIAFSEIGPDLMAVSDDGYRCIVGSTPKKPILFDTYADHPRRLMSVFGVKSTAAGRYQILARIFDAYKPLVGVKDFSPESQDKIALQLIRERGALPMIDSGNINDAVRVVSKIWASLPGAGYGQNENSLAVLRIAYANSGGKFA